MIKLNIKFLVIRLSSIGDIVLTSPVVRCLKNQVEDAEIHFVVKEKYASLVQGNPNITKTHILHENLNELLDELEKEQFDYIIDLHYNFRSARIKNRLKLLAFSVDKLNYQKWLFINFKINRLPDKHIVDRYIETLSAFDVVNDQQGLDYFIPEGEGYNFGKLPGSFNNGYIAMVIAGTYFTKKLPAEKVAELCRMANHPIILLGGKKEAAEGKQIAELFPGKVISLCGQTTLNESASLVKNARLVLTNDTGLMHIAAAFKKKILSFWGNTTPQFGMVPYLPDPASKISEVPGLKCRPCSKLGYDKCPKKHFRCMAEQNIAEAARWVEENF
jgi:ADP-heptose:LPS heptosyltransferase